MRFPRCGLLLVSTANGTACCWLLPSVRLCPLKGSIAAASKPKLIAEVRAGGKQTAQQAEVVRPSSTAGSVDAKSRQEVFFKVQRAVSVLLTLQELRLLAAVVAKNAVGSSWRKIIATREWSRVPGVRAGRQALFLLQASQGPAGTPLASTRSGSLCDCNAALAGPHESTALSHEFFFSKKMVLWAGRSHSYVHPLGPTCR